MDEWRGYSYWFLLDNRLAQWLWRKLFCRIGWHLWDEVLSDLGHRLYCDACEEELVIDSPRGEGC